MFSSGWLFGFRMATDCGYHYWVNTLDWIKFGQCLQQLQCGISVTVGSLEAGFDVLQRLAGLHMQPNRDGQVVALSFHHSKTQ
jgi:hypothetical protein